MSVLEGLALNLMEPTGQWFMPAVYRLQESHFPPAIQDSKSLQAVNEKTKQHIGSRGRV